MPARKKNSTEPIVEPIIEPEYIEEPVIQHDDDTVTFKRSHFYAALTVLAFAAGILVGYVVWGTGDSAQTASQSSGQLIDAPVTAQPQYTRYDIPTEGFHSLGPADAPITIVEFSDFQCPYCRRWHDETYEPLLAAYPGQIRIVYRHLPLESIHPDAFPAAEAAMCAGEQNVFWQYHDKLFSSESLGSAVYEQYARELSLDIPTFDRLWAESPASFGHGVGNQGASKQTICIVSNFRPAKCLDNLLEAFAIVLQSAPEAQLSVVGDGPLRGNLEDMAKRLGLEDHVVAPEAE